MSDHNSISDKPRTQLVTLGVLEGMPQISLECGRVTVILGANGTGKSQLARRMLRQARHCFPEIAQVHGVEGGRALTISSSLKGDRAFPVQRQNTSAQDRLEYATQQSSANLAMRLPKAFAWMARRTEIENSEFGRQVHKWQETGRADEMPKRPPSPFERLGRLFKDIFPDLSLNYDFDAQAMSCTKDGNQYGVEALSDGEKQVLGLLADIIILGTSRSLFVVDEPEINLHTGLATRLWDLIEREFQDSYFIYFTHNISFAIRPSVEVVHVLSPERAPLRLARIQDLSERERLEFLGALPSMLSTNRVLAVEGTERSFDADFYEWIVGEGRLTVLPAGECAAVRAVVRGVGIWETATNSGVRTVGVVDRDYLSGSGKDSTERDLVVLPFHEAESYLCLPRIIHEIASKAALLYPVPAVSEIEQMVLAYASRNQLRTAVQRLIVGSRTVLDLSLEKKALATLSSLSDAVALLVSRHTANSTIPDWHDHRVVESLLEAEQTQISNAIARRDIVAILQLVPGKQLLQEMATHLGFRSGSQVLTSGRANVSVATHPELASLRTQLREALGLPAGVQEAASPQPATVGPMTTKP